jgi:AraC family transcriptional regulator
MFIKTEIIQEKKFIGNNLTMSFSQNKTHELWQNFTPKLGAIKNRVNNNLYSLAVYPTNYFNSFNPSVAFEKWALTEVSDFNSVPPDMKTLTLPSGMYAVFLYRGMAKDAAPFFQSIFNNWLPESVYQLDNRPHFEIIDDRYKNNDTTSEEEIWIPVTLK